jgi:molybdenum cofactor cytidylyltransferase
MGDRLPLPCSAVLLAAGESRRLGGVNKLALPVGGVPLVRRTARTLLAAAFEEVVVVLGHEAARVRALLDGLPLSFVENGHYREGQMTSVHAGLAALARPSDAVLVCLSDLPLVDTADIARIVGAFARRERGAILAPAYRGARGNPVVMAREYAASLVSGERGLGCRRLVDRDPDLVVTLEMDDDHVVFDLDTPADLARLQERLIGRRDQVADAGGRSRVNSKASEKI